MEILNPFAKALLLILVGAAVLYIAPSSARAQICAGSSLRYLVRDERGKVIDPTGVYEPKARSEIDGLKDAQKAIKGITGNSVRVIHARGMCNFPEPSHTET